LSVDFVIPSLLRMGLEPHTFEEAVRVRQTVYAEAIMVPLNRSLS